MFRQKCSIEKLRQKNRQLVLSIFILKNRQRRHLFCHSQQRTRNTGPTRFAGCAAGTRHVTDQMEKPDYHTVEQFFRNIFANQSQSFFGNRDYHKRSVGVRSIGLLGKLGQQRKYQTGRCGMVCKIPEMVLQSAAKIRRIFVTGDAELLFQKAYCSLQIFSRVASQTRHFHNKLLCLAAAPLAAPPQIKGSSPHDIQDTANQPASNRRQIVTAICMAGQQIHLGIQIKNDPVKIILLFRQLRCHINLCRFAFFFAHRLFLPNKLNLRFFHPDLQSIRRFPAV